jgi:spore maturation protein CgeB
VLWLTQGATHLGVPLKITIFGLTLSSSWGNGHATPYRAILRALARQGHQVTFFEKDAHYYAGHRDLVRCDFCELVLYETWEDCRRPALSIAADSDITIVASYCPQGSRISDELLELDHPLKVYYDLDTPVTLSRLRRGEVVDYVRADQLQEFDLVLSWTGGTALEQLREFGVEMPRPLYGCVDPDVYRRQSVREQFRCALSYMGTYAPDRQEKLDALFLEPSRLRPDLNFLLAGSLYPPGWHWGSNVTKIEHVAPADHPALYSSSRCTLNITRAEMSSSGYCPSGRFFEAAACATPIISDWFDGLDDFFTPGEELFIAHSAEDTLRAVSAPGEQLRHMAERARQRTLDSHTGEHRARELVRHCEEARARVSSEKYQTLTPADGCREVA